MTTSETNPDARFLFLQWPPRMKSGKWNKSLEDVYQYVVYKNSPLENGLGREMVMNAFFAVTSANRVRVGEIS